MQIWQTYMLQVIKPIFILEKDHLSKYSMQFLKYDLIYYKKKSFPNLSGTM